MIKLIIDGFIALGTVAVAILAIWSDWFRSKFAPAKLSLSGHTLDGDPTLFATGARAMFYQRYQLQIEAVNFTSPIYVFEVAWDGVWDFVPIQ